MDARLLLGLPRDANRAQVREAAARLGAHLASEPEARRLVDAAAGALLAGRTTVAVPIDPARLLRVPHLAAGDEVRAAYLRLARAAHPDAGGTDELFRVVAAAYDALTVAGSRSAWNVWRARAGFDRDPPPAPPPPGPWRPPPLDARPAPPGWRAWTTFGAQLATLGAGVAVVAFLATGSLVMQAMATSVAVAFVVLLRGTVAGAIRGAVVLLGSRLRIRKDADPVEFLMDSCLDAPVAREREDVVYDEYILWCRDRRSAPVAHWVFVERLRSVGLLFVKASAWQTGTWVGIRLR